MEPNAPKLILVPTDFSAPSAQALRYGAALAERFGAHLLVIFADPFIPPIDFTISAAGTFSLPREEMIEGAREQLQRFAEANIPRAVPYDVRVVIDAAVQGILMQVAETGADLIVMGTHGRTGLRRLLVGSVTEEVMRLAPVPVIALHELMNESAGARWVVGSIAPARECRAALRYATNLADEGSEFVLLGASDVAGRPFTTVDLELLEVCTPGEILGRTRFEVVEAVEPEEVLTIADVDHADLIVLGVSGERTLADMLRGTLVERVVQHSTCPVLTVNRFAAARLAGVNVHEREPALTA